MRIQKRRHDWHAVADRVTVGAIIVLSLPLFGTTSPPDARCVGVNDTTIICIHHVQAPGFQVE